MWPTASGYPGDQIQKCKNKLALHKARKRKRAK